MLELRRLYDSTALTLTPAQKKRVGLLLAHCGTQYQHNVSAAARRRNQGSESGVQLSAPDRSLLSSIADSLKSMTEMYAMVVSLLSPFPCFSLSSFVSLWTELFKADSDPFQNRFPRPSTHTSEIDKYMFAEPPKHKFTKGKKLRVLSPTTAPVRRNRTVPPSGDGEVQSTDEPEAPPPAEAGSSSSVVPPAPPQVEEPGFVAINSGGGAGGGE
jgi:hypothetical protein